MENKSIYCTLTDQQLFGKAEQLIQGLIDTGGRSFTMRVPARPNEDTDLILSELNNRFKALINQVEEVKKREKKIIEAVDYAKIRLKALLPADEKQIAFIFEKLNEALADLS